MHDLSAEARARARSLADDGGKDRALLTQTAFAGELVYSIGALNPFDPWR